MAIVVGADSYVGLGEADDMATGRYGAQSWLNAENEDKELALTTATQRIDRLTLIGSKADSEQILAFPRCYSVWVEGEPKTRCDESVLPNVCRACFEEALAILSGEALDRETKFASSEAARYLKPYDASTSLRGA